MAARANGDALPTPEVAARLKDLLRGVTTSLSIRDRTDRHRGRLLRQINLSVDLERARRVYREEDGFPAAVEDHLEDGEVSSETVDIPGEGIAPDVRSGRRSELATLRLLRGLSLGALLA